MIMENFNKIFIEKTHCLVFQASLYNETSKSWIGGKAPALFDSREDLVNANGRQYYFYLTIVNPFKEDRAISIFIPADFEDYLENQIYPDCSIQIFEHPVTAESDRNIFTHPDLIKHSIDDGEIVSDKASMEQSFLIKMGGSPRLIQDEKYYFAKLMEDSFAFLLQVDEDGYPSTLVKGNMPFNFGALYVFTQLQEHGAFKQTVAGFWQFS